MNKILITIATIVAFALSSVAFADVKVSGFMQQIVGAGDDVDGGITYKFNRYAFGADTTTDNGWTVGGSFAIEVGNLAGGGLSGYLPSSNFLWSLPYFTATTSSKFLTSQPSGIHLFNVSLKMNLLGNNFLRSSGSLLDTESSSA